MKYNIAQVIGLNTDQKAAQAISTNQDSNNFLAVLNLACDDAFTKGRQLLSEISDFYFESEGSPAEKINSAFLEAIQKLKQLEAKNFDLCLAVVFNKILYLISEGQIEVFLTRDHKLSSLSSLGASSQLISGFLEDGDKVLFATSSLTSFLGEDLTKTFDLPIEVFEEDVSSKIAAANLDQESLAGLIMEFVDEEVMVPPLNETGEQVVLEQSDITSQETSNLGIPTYIFGKVITGIPPLIKKVFPKSGRSKLILGVVLMVIILFGAGLKYKNNQDQQKILAFNQLLQKARDNFNNAKGLQSLNPKEAKNNLDLAKANANQALSIRPKDQEAQNLKKQIEENADSIIQQFTASNFPVFLDLELVKKNFRADKMSLSSGNILLLDPGTKTLITVGLAKKNNQILAGSEQLGEAEYFSLNGGLAFVFSKNKGIVRIDITNQKQVTVAKKTDLGQIADIYGFAGNVYLLDITNQKIWKYLPTSEGYSDKREYFSKNTKVDLSDSLRMQIESSIYVLKKGGEILRFTKGDKDNFSLGGLPSGVKDPKSFFVSSDTDNLYLLDSGNSRLLVLTKIGQFKSQYQGDRFATATDLVVDEAGKKVYLLEGSKIYSTDLK